MTTRNRIVFSAHLTNYARDGKPTEQHAAYYAARAAGGTGLIITEEHSTHPTDWPYEKLIHGFHRDVIPGYRAITDAVHRHRVADLRPDQPQRRPGQLDVLPPAGVGAVAPWPTRCSARCPRRSPRPRSTRSSPATRSSPSTAPRVASTASSCSAATRRSCAASSRRRRTSAPTSTAARWTTARGCCCASSPRCASVIGNRLALGVRICGDELIDGGTTIDDAVEVARIGRGQRAGRLHQHLDRRRHRQPVHDRGEHAHPAGLRDVHPVRVPQGGRPAGDRRRPVQGSAAGRAGAGRGALRPRRRRARPDRRRRLRRQGPRRRHRRDPPVPQLQPGVRRPDGPEPLARLHREPAHRPRGAAASG